VITSVVAGLVIGVILGSLGGGGAILSLPVLVFALGLTPHDAASASLVIVGITSAIALVEHARAGRVHWRDGLVFGVVGAVGTVFGTTLARRVDGHTLLLAFAGLLLVVAAVLWRRASAAARPEGQEPPALAANRAASIMGAATAVGLLTGFFGVGGGFAVVPALVIALGFTMREAVATSLLVLTLNTASALVARAFGDGLALDWSVIAPFTVATVLGSFVGARLGPRLPDRLLQRSFAILLVGVGVYTAWQSLT
jgi:uncharacterized membrane protein YfcA